LKLKLIYFGQDLNEKTYMKSLGAIGCTRFSIKS
jgi:hypothetical protein